MKYKNTGSLFEWGIHNIYKGVCQTCHIPLVRVIKDPSLKQLQKLQSAKPFVLSNTFESKIYPEREAQRNYTSSDVYLWELSHGFVAGDTAYPFTPNGQLVAVSRDVVNSKNNSVRRPIPFLAHNVDFPLFHFAGANNENRAHFRTQFLPRLMACLPFLKSRPDVKILLAAGHKRWQTQYFELFGIPADRLIEGGYGTWKIKQLYYAPFLYNNYVLSQPDHYRQIRDAVAPSQNGDKVLLISRMDAPDRRIINEDALFCLIKTFWPQAQRVIMGKLSLMEQVTLFSQARVVIGGHGAGISGMLFCSNALLLQITPHLVKSDAVDDWTLAFNQLSSAVGCRAVRLEANPIWQEKNYICDLEHMRKEISRIRQVAGI